MTPWILLIIKTLSALSSNSSRKSNQDDLPSDTPRGIPEVVIHKLCRLATPHKSQSQLCIKNLSRKIKLWRNSFSLNGTCSNVKPPMAPKKFFAPCSLFVGQPIDPGNCLKSQNVKLIKRLCLVSVCESCHLTCMCNCRAALRALVPQVEAIRA